MAREYDHLFKLLIIGDSGEWARFSNRIKIKWPEKRRTIGHPSEILLAWKFGILVMVEWPRFVIKRIVCCIGLCDIVRRTDKVAMSRFAYNECEIVCVHMCVHVFVRVCFCWHRKARVVRDEHKTHLCSMDLTCVQCMIYYCLMGCDCVIARL